MRSHAIALLIMASALGCSRVETPPYGGERESALVAATAANDVAKVQQLLASGADPNKMVPHEGRNQSAWRLALDNFRPGHAEQLEIVRAMLQAGANTDAAWGTSRGTSQRAPRRQDQIPLLIAMQHPDPQLVRAILDAKRDALERGTALVMAIERRQTEIAHLLVDSGLDVNVHPGANTPLLAAIEARDEAMMIYLEQHGAREKP